MARAVREELAQRHRYAHVLRVARMAESLALTHGADAGRAREASLLHDLARLYSGERLLRECAERGMPVDDFERANPVVLHARLGAELARERFGVDDDAVLSAIRKHTLADAVMSPLDEIVYLADGLEPGRDFPDRAPLAETAFADLHAAMRGVLASTIAHELRQGRMLAPQTLAAARRYGVAVPSEERRPV
ncbi:MAG TPA: bis(5'-nucleosyl)-tetraphosphatase (symmetrical) YqeK [Candidatus Elarobacter sp.]|jgi:predicted HD superfamily hydrolase involved in NAD metabolism|nr:bis(5'-nucleosyl)-tetraphosphatase (symmetrical) YqeK [Candidatus Elarobacter sp.]